MSRLVPRETTGKALGALESGEPAALSAGDVTIGACAGLGVLALTTMALIVSGAPRTFPLFGLIHIANTLLIVVGLIAAVRTDAAFPRKLFASSSVLFLALPVLEILGVGSILRHIGFAGVMLGGGAWWLRTRRCEPEPAPILPEAEQPSALPPSSNAV